MSVVRAVPVVPLVPAEHGTPDGYVPGVCNIGTWEIRRRRAFAVLGFVLALALFAVLVAIDAPAWTRLLVFLPLAGGVFSWLQARRRFCAAFAVAGVANFADADEGRHAVQDEAARRADLAAVRRMTRDAVPHRAADRHRRGAAARLTTRRRTGGGHGTAGHPPRRSAPRSRGSTVRSGRPAVRRDCPGGVRRQACVVRVPDTLSPMETRWRPTRPAGAGHDARLGTAVGAVRAGLGGGAVQAADAVVDQVVDVVLVQGLVHGVHSFGVPEHRDGLGVGGGLISHVC